MECAYKQGGECSLSRVLTNSCIEKFTEDSKPLCNIYHTALALEQNKKLLSELSKELSNNRRIISNLTKLLFVIHDVYLIEKDNKWYACLTLDDEICMWEVNDDEIEKEEYSSIPRRKRHRHSKNIQTF